MKLPFLQNSILDTNGFTLPSPASPEANLQDIRCQFEEAKRELDNLEMKPRERGV
jgi:hypothetical protein